MKTPKTIEKMYIITKDETGKFHHYKASVAMHADLLERFNINLDKETIIEKGFLTANHHITSSFDARGDEVRKEHNKRRNDRE